jgi:hypothetical protein
MAVGVQRRFEGLGQILPSAGKYRVKKANICLLVG